MHIAVFDWFGWSLLWLIPLVVREVKARRAGTTALRGPGSIRLWLGTLFILCGSSALEALLRGSGSTPPNGDFAGQALARGFTGVLGNILGILALMAICTIALSWLFGRERAKSTTRSGEAPRSAPGKIETTETAREPRIARVTRATPSAVATAAVTRPLPARQRESIAAPPRTRKSWQLPSRSDLPDLSKKMPGTPRQAPAKQQEQKSGGRAMSEWASFERIIPTPAMRARANTAQLAQTSSAARGDAINRGTVERAQQRPQIRTISTRPVGAHSSTAAVATATTIAASAVPVTEALVHDLQGAVAQAANSYSAPLANAPSVFQPPPAQAIATQTARDDIARVGTAATQYPTAAMSAATLPSHTAVDRIDAVVAPQTSAAAQPAVAASPPTLIFEDDDEAPFQLRHESRVELPGLDLLDPAVNESIEISVERLAETGLLIEQRLREFKVPVTVLGADAGPVITRFEVEPALGVRGSQIVGLMKDLSRALGLTSIRVVETIPGKTCMGLELPNPKRQMIKLSEILEAPAYQDSSSHLTLALGKDITGKPVVADLARAPHMLVAGTTGSGKSVAINAMILSLLYKATPEEVRLIMIDPKMLELSVYEGIPHLLAPVVTDMKLAANALTWCVAEMDKRYRLMSALGVRNLAGFNQKIRDAEKREKKVSNPFSLTPDAPEPLTTLPMIVVIIDELADLMMVTGKKIEELIARLAQKARAAGIHLILATQRPSVDVITGLIKANIPTRVAFQVSSKIDSRTILDQMGAEALLGHGDMLFLPPGSGYPQRVHGAFVSDAEVHRVVEHLKQFGEPEYEEAILAGVPAEGATTDLLGDSQDVEADPLYDEAVAFVVRTRRASISSVQRQFRVGYNRAARLVEQMETAGIVSSVATNGSRDVLAPPQIE
ncbi:DNA translocase FtsK [Collimonas arenae]|uniref:DNA translocase FtsK n=1 Tax=Collimonas arenae TaxID=279058 RepID=UPI0007783FF5|nr:DNA translocase FtsK [Collimonas arenae]